MLNAHVTLRTLIITEQEENQFTYSSPLKIRRWLNIERVHPEVYLTSISRSYFNHLLCAVPPRSALLRNEMPFSPLKTPKIHAL